MEANVLNNVLALTLGLVIGLLLGLVYVLIWKARHTGAIRLDAIQRSQAVTIGKVSEQIVPFLPDFPFNPKDARFLGSPVDLVVFDGLDEGEVRRVVFIEIKTGTAGLSGRERQVRDAIQARRVEWTELRVPQNVSSTPSRTTLGAPK
jgi:predicted Holliday junction resolvase-like endonuclease